MSSSEQNSMPPILMVKVEEPDFESSILAIKEENLDAESVIEEGEEEGREEEEEEEEEEEDAEEEEGEDEDEEDECTPSDIVEPVGSATANFLSMKSRQKYESVYDRFMEWRKSKNTSSFSENVLLTYFHELSTKFKPSTLWSQYSMLRSTINNKHDIDMSTYSKVIAFMKQQSSGYTSKKSKVLTLNEVQEFLSKAPDKKYLATKVALIFGVIGGCRREELCKIRTKDINDAGSMVLIKISRPNTKIQRSFTVVDEFYKIFKKYKDLRPENTITDRFFLNYQNGKCTSQVIGINKFGSMPKQIASFLNLPDPESYTGHSFRRTSASLLADTGADRMTLKRHGGYKTNRMAEECVEDPLNDKMDIRKQITESVHLHLTSSSNIGEIVRLCSTDSAVERVSLPKRMKLPDDQFTTNDGTSTSKDDTKTFTHENYTLNFSQCSNITIHIHKKQ